MERWMPFRHRYTYRYICSDGALEPSFLTLALINFNRVYRRGDLFEFKDRFHHGNKNKS